MINQLTHQAEQWGYTVTWARMPEKYVAATDNTTRTLYLNIKFSPEDRHLTTALAHELGHAHHQHQHHGNPAQERQADLYAAKLLITPTAYARAEHKHGNCPTKLAAELNTTVRIVCTYQDWLATRTG